MRSVQEEEKNRKLFYTISTITFDNWLRTGSREDQNLIDVMDVMDRGISSMTEEYSASRQEGNI